MRSQITADTTNPRYVTVTTDHEYSDERVSTTYFVPIHGGYVRILDAQHTNRQTCEGLSGYGNTLSYDRCDPITGLVDTAGFLAMIRREYRRGRSAEARRAHAR